jgi:hypothetical protein
VPHYSSEIFKTVLRLRKRRPATGDLSENDNQVPRRAFETLKASLKKKRGGIPRIFAKKQLTEALRASRGDFCSFVLPLKRVGLSMSIITKSQGALYAAARKSLPATPGLPASRQV